MKTKSLKNRLKAVLVAFVSVLLCMGTLAMPAFAEEVSTGIVPEGGTATDYVLAQADAKISKTYDWAPGAAAQDQTFTFSVTKAANTDAPEIANQTIVLKAADAQNVNGLMTVTGSTQLIPSDTDFPHAGLYYYTVTEVAGSASGVSYNTGAASYTVTVNVINAGTTEDPTATSVKEITIVKDGVKYDSAAFLNRFTENAADLVISKTVPDDSGDKTLDFNYTITFTASPAETTAYTIIWTNSNGTTTGSFELDPTSTTYNTYTMTFALKDAKNITFTGAKAGTTYTVTELLANGAAFSEYTPKVTVVDNGATAVTSQGPKATNLNASGTLGAQTNTAAYTNNRENITITGIFTDNLPYILLVVGIIGAGAVYYTMRRRHAA